MVESVDMVARFDSQVCNVEKVLQLVEPEPVAQQRSLAEIVCRVADKLVAI